MTTSFLLLFVLQTLALALSGNPPPGKPKSQLISELLDPAQYNPSSRPGEDDNSGPTNVTAQLYIRTIRSIDRKDMEITLQVTFRQKWLDPRLRYSPDSSTSYLLLPSRDSVWTPDTFFRNELEAKRHRVMKDNFYVKVFPDGQVWASDRLTLTLACPMNLRDYPFETNTCTMQLASYAHTGSTVVYSWKDESPVQLAASLSLPGMTSLDGVKPGRCDVKTSSGTYSCLKVELELRHQASFQVLTLFVPCAMWVVVSWLAAWLKRDQLLPRLLLTTLSLYSLCALSRDSQEGLPRVAYTKAIDVWTGSCIMFAFICLLEVILVNLLLPSIKEVEEPKGGTWKGLACFHTFRAAHFTHKLDIAFRLLNPTVFLLFCIIYVTTY